MPRPRPRSSPKTQRTLAGSGRAAFRLEPYRHVCVRPDPPTIPSLVFDSNPSTVLLVSHSLDAYLYGTERSLNNAKLSQVAPRDRIIETARRLFRVHGIRGVSVDSIVAEAGTNKMTLYRHFASKDALVARCLSHRAADEMDKRQALESAHPKELRAQLLAWVATNARNLATNARGCDLSNASVELADEPQHVARAVVADFKNDERRWLSNICAKADLTKPEETAQALLLLLEGARVARQNESYYQAGKIFELSARSVIEGASKRPKRSRGGGPERGVSKG